MYSKILHPTDFSESSLPALQAASELAKELGSQLVVCFLAHPPLVASGTSLTNAESGTTRDLAAELAAHCPEDPAVQRELKVVITDASTRVKTVLGFVEDLGCDLLVIGMHRRAGVAGWFTHSVTEEVVRTARCAVLVVKQQASDEADSEEIVSENETGIE